MSNRYPLWKYLLMLGLILLALIYAAPNIFPQDPSVQISAKTGAQVNASVLAQVEQALKAQNTAYLSAQLLPESILVRFSNTDAELKGRDVVKAALGDNYVVALNLVRRTPRWLEALGAQPMKLGLDLRGGVNFLLEVDLDSVIKARQEADASAIASDLREKSIRYSGISKETNTIVVQFRDADNRDKASSQLASHFTDYQFTQNSKAGQLSIVGTLTPAAIQSIANYAVDQNMLVLSKIVNELGVSEAVVQRQGKSRISVELPGVLDTTRAKDLLGKVATLKFQLVDTDADLQSAIAGSVPLGDKLYKIHEMPLLVKNQVVLSGSSITYASANISSEGRPAVSVRLGGGGESLFNRITSENIGKPMAIIYIETTSETHMVNGKPVTALKQTEKVLSAPIIQGALTNNFEITGLADMKEAQNLALMLRSGSLTAPMSIIQERTIGPSLGAENIHKGVMSVIVGALAVIVFMALYYRVFGLIGDFALLLNVVFIIAIMSILGATLTLPGIAGIVLTMGVAVDANVLINERIREELRNGMSPHASIHTGYERAFTTIVDANVTTLIVAMVLFALGSGLVKGFAITLTIGILASMVTNVYFTRAIVNWVYGNRAVKSLSIGIKVNPNKVKA